MCPSHINLTPWPTDKHMGPNVFLVLKGHSVPGHLHPLAWSLLGPLFRDNAWVEGWSGATCPVWTIHIPFLLGRQASLQKNLSYILYSQGSAPQCPGCPTAPPLSAQTPRPAPWFSPHGALPGQLHIWKCSGVREPTPGSEAEPMGWLILDSGDKTTRHFQC